MCIDEREDFSLFRFENWTSNRKNEDWTTILKRWCIFTLSKES